MGREIKRVPMDFAFPIDASFADAAYAKHRETCKLEEHDECEIGNEPPKGEGWQLWQTVSDGPVTPVFATAAELLEFMCQPVPPDEQVRYDPGPYPRLPAGKGWRRDVAEALVKAGWAPSMGIHNGVASFGPDALIRKT